MLGKTTIATPVVGIMKTHLGNCCFQIKLPSLRYFYGESVNAIKIPICCVFIANLLLTMTNNSLSVLILSPLWELLIIVNHSFSTLFYLIERSSSQHSIKVVLK